MHLVFLYRKHHFSYKVDFYKNKIKILEIRQVQGFHKAYVKENSLLQNQGKL